MVITERFKRVADDVIQYQFTVDDPVTYARPFTMSMPLTPLVGGVLLPYECHEGNGAVQNALSAERAEDAAIAADLAKGIKRARRGGAGRRRRRAAAWRGGGRRTRRKRTDGLGAGCSAPAGTLEISRADRQTRASRLPTGDRHEATCISGGCGGRGLFAAAARCRSAGQAPARRRWSSPPTTAARRSPTPCRGRRGAIPTCRASGRATTRRGIPMSRPAGARRPRSIMTDEQFAARQKQIAERRPERRERRSARSAATSPGAPSGRPRLIVDPPDGRQPQPLPRREKRARAARPGHVRQRPVRHASTTSRSTTAASRAASGARCMRVVYGNGNRIVQAPGMVAISYEMIHDTRVFYTDGRPHIGNVDPPVPRRLARALGRRRAGGRDDQPDRQDQHRPERQRPAPQRQDEDHRALQARRATTSCSTRSRSTTR